jgi:hypothetical protein
MPEMQRRSGFAIVLAAALVSLISFLYFFHHNEILLYGDAVAHINIARRVFDSQQPGPVQLGTVWLPLPHVLMLLFVIPDWAWRTGAGPSIISMAAYVFGALGIFRLVRARVGRKTACLAALAYVLNPNLIYLQTTAMTEPLYLALFIWAMVFLSEFFDASRAADQRHANQSLRRCMYFTAAMMLTRYDGWFVAIWFEAILFLHVFRSRELVAQEFRRACLNFLLPLACVGILWLAYNQLVFHDALAFLRGPYSARAIAARSAATSNFTAPGDHHPYVAGLYFLQAAQLNLGEGSWGSAWLLAAIAGALAILLYAPRARVLLLLWLPLPFYALSVAYAGAPIFVPVWWPFSYYNVRYGLELLPAIAVCGAVLFALAARRPLRV